MVIDKITSEESEVLAYLTLCQSETQNQIDRLIEHMCKIRHQIVKTTIRIGTAHNIDFACGLYQINGKGEITINGEND